MNVYLLKHPGFKDFYAAEDRAPHDPKSKKPAPDGWSWRVAGIYCIAVVGLSSRYVMPDVLVWSSTRIAPFSPATEGIRIALAKVGVSARASEMMVFMPRGCEIGALDARIADLRIQASKVITGIGTTTKFKDRKKAWAKAERLNNEADALDMKASRLSGYLTRG